MAFNNRALHYVLRVANREASYKFFTEVLGMKVLRHEEFIEGCKATCNGPYDNMWSKTMVGYGPEDGHFVLELTYNYTVHTYELGNDFNSITIESDRVLGRVTEKGLGQPQPEDGLSVKDPDGHTFYVKGGQTERPMTMVAINVQNLHDSKDFWGRVLGMAVENEGDDSCLLSYGEGQCKVELCALKGEGTNVERGTAFGRIAFATPTEGLRHMQELIEAEDKNLIQQPLVTLDTPGKATVSVVIVRDPNGHEICFVGGEAFMKLSKIDPNADESLRKAIEKDNLVK